MGPPRGQAQISFVAMHFPKQYLSAIALAGCVDVFVEKERASAQGVLLFFTPSATHCSSVRVLLSERETQTLSCVLGHYSCWLASRTTSDITSAVTKSTLANYAYNNAAQMNKTTSCI
jgi:hypothetical protein